MGTSGLICPICQGEILEGQAAKCCEGCGVWHHLECWEKNQGCSTDTCRAHQDVQPSAEPAGEWEPQAPVSEPVTDSSARPPEEPGGKKKKKTWLLILAVLLAVILVIAGAAAFLIGRANRRQNEQEARQRQENAQYAVACYRDDAKAFCMTSIMLGSGMEDIGNEVKKFWGAYIINQTSYKGHSFYSAQSAVSASRIEQSENIEKAKKAAPMMKSMYEALQNLPDENDEELQDIKDAVKELYAAYEDMYDCVMDVSGSYISFGSRFSSADSTLARKYRALNSLLD